MKLNQKVLLKHRSEFLIHVPDYLRKFFACILPKVLKGKPQAPKHCAYPYEGEGVFGHESYDTPGSYEFTYRGEAELGTDLYIKVTLDEMQQIAAGKKSILKFWRCTLPECGRSQHSPDATCAECQEKCQRAQWSKKQIAAERRRERSLQRWGLKMLEEAEATLPETKPKKYPIRAIIYNESPTLGRLVDMGRKNCATQITAVDASDGKPVRFLRLDKTSRVLGCGLRGVTLSFPRDSIPVGEIAWELANLRISWGTQNRLRYAPERPIYGARDLWLYSLSIGSNDSCWDPMIYDTKQIPTPDDFDIAVRLGFKERQKPTL